MTNPDQQVAVPAWAVAYAVRYGTSRDSYARDDARRLAEEHWHLLDGATRDDVRRAFPDFAPPAERTPCKAAVWIDPAILGGEPCLGGHRIPILNLVTEVAESSVDETMADHTLDASERREVLVAMAWFVLMRNGPRAGWKAWAQRTWSAARHPSTPTLADPPGRFVEADK